MMKKEIINVDADYLNTLNSDVLDLIKEEAYTHLDDIESSTNIVSSKASSMFQIFMALFVGVFGYMVADYKNISTDSILYHCAIGFSIVMATCLILLHKSLTLKSIWLKGVAPYKISKKDLVEAYDKATEKPSESITGKGILINRIHNINIHIQENHIILKERSRLVKRSSYVFMYGMAAIVAYFIVVLFCQHYCQFFQC